MPLVFVMLNCPNKPLEEILLMMNESRLLKEFPLNFTTARIEGLVTVEANDAQHASPSVVIPDLYST